MRIALTRRRAIIGGATIALIAWMIWLGRPRPLSVETARAERADLAVTVDEDGKTRVADRYMVTAPVTGRLERIPLDEGIRISQGDAVARIQPLPLDRRTREQLEAQRNAALARGRATTAALGRAEAAYEQAKRELERRRTLAGQGAIAEEQVEQYALAERSRAEELEAARETAHAASADVDAVSAALLAAGDDATGGAAVIVRAPADGDVLRVPERSGRIVGAGEILIELGGTGVIEAIIDVLSPDAVRIRPGMPVRFTGWGGAPLEGRVRRVEPAAFTRLSALGVEEQRVNVIADIDDCPPELGDGFRVEASITVWSGEDVLVVPSSALFRSGDAWRTFVVEAGRAQVRDVVTGERGGAMTHVLSGLEEGDEVILFPSDELADGTRVDAGGP